MRVKMAVAVFKASGLSFFIVGIAAARNPATAAYLEAPMTAASSAALAHWSKWPFFLMAENIACVVPLHIPGSWRMVLMLWQYSAALASTRARVRLNPIQAARLAARFAAVVASARPLATARRFRAAVMAGVSRETTRLVWRTIRASAAFLKDPSTKGGGAWYGLTLSLAPGSKKPSFKYPSVLWSKCSEGSAVCPTATATSATNRCIAGDGA
mmetsp:Transcript_45737/g.99313  ORF Transcript_45737/g.99313 Transcript_45737/m.99313 type:complete len:213 (-) Transcript_45737:95-733(-)